ncbi:hypothetical protein QBC40DRAFT_24429 [Triangularia verruculosa]|uniref:Ankyrin repeat protein n=1 Tax=Triangularia verruculosa TaxID=2587418 RepID=A0AAN6X6R0_9PEZI|nr:hypothetical protein QBC40DRAFT_24429 [Triangularia verruculosa]
MSRGADTWSTGDCDWSVPHQLAAYGELELLREVLERHPEQPIDAVDSCGSTPLYNAYINRHFDTVIPFLLSRGADINTSVDVDTLHRLEIMTTPLGEACSLSHFEAALKLVELGADVMQGARVSYRTGELERLPLLALCVMDIAKSSRRDNAVARKKLITRLIADGAPLQWEYAPVRMSGGQSTSQTMTILAFAAHFSRTEVVKELLAAGVDVRQSDDLGRNALMSLLGGLFRTEDHALPSYREDQGYVASTRSGSVLGLTRLLLDAGLGPNEQDSDGRTALHHMFMAHPGNSSRRLRNQEMEDIVRLLLARGADPLIQDKRGFSAVRRAIRGKCTRAFDTICRIRPFELKDAFPTPEDILDAFYDTGYDEALASDMDGDMDQDMDQDLDEQNVNANELADYGPVAYWGSGRWDREGRYTSSKEETITLISSLCDLDRCGRHLSDPSFLRCCFPLLYSFQFRSDTRIFTQVFGVLCRRGIDLSRFKPAERRRMQILIVDYFNETGIITDDAAIRAVLDTVPDDEIDMPDDNGETFLFRALARKNDSPGIEYIQELLSRGADCHKIIHSKLREGPSTSIGMAIQHRHVGPAVVLLEEQPIAGNPQAATQRYLHAAVDLSQTGASLSPNEIATMTDSLVKALLRSGADPAQQDSRGNTPLSFLFSQLADHRPVIQPLFDRNIFAKLYNRNEAVQFDQLNKDGKSIIMYMSEML